MSAGNTIYVGSSKPPMEYVMFILSSFHGRKLDEVVLKARGRAICIAVDAAEITRNRYMKGLKPSVNIGTEQMKSEDGRNRNVSTIEIILRKSPEAEEPRGRELTTEAEDAA